MHWNDLTSLIPCDYKITRVDSPSRGQNASTTTARARRTPADYANRSPLERWMGTHTLNWAACTVDPSGRVLIRAIIPL